MSVMNKWMNGSIGISVHWTSLSTGKDGSRGSFAENTEQFDVTRFTESLVNVGATHCLLTLTHAEQYLCFPNPALEHVLQGRTTERDLLGDIADALKSAGIRFLAYYNHSCNGDDDIPWKKACGYADGIRGNLDIFARNICNIVRYTAGHLGNRLDGWWFDSAYSIDPRGPHNTISCEMGEWQFPWDKLICAAKSGSRNCAVAVNAGVGCNFLYTQDIDYAAGEAVQLDEKFSELPLRDIVDHRWTTIDDPRWVFIADGGNGFSQPRFDDRSVTSFIYKNNKEGRMITFNMQIDRFGEINPYALSQFRRTVQSAKGC